MRKCYRFALASIALGVSTVIGGSLATTVLAAEACCAKFQNGNCVTPDSCTGHCTPCDQKNKRDPHPRTDKCGVGSDAKTCVPDTSLPQDVPCYDLIDCTEDTLMQCPLDSNKKLCKETNRRPTVKTYRNKLSDACPKSS